MDNGLMTPCVHIVCYECLMGCLSKNSKGACPICRRDIPENELVPITSETNSEKKETKKEKDSNSFVSSTKVGF